MTDPKVYFVHLRGERRGPLTFEELDAMAVSGELSPEDLVWESGAPRWEPAAKLLYFVPSAPRPVPPLPPAPGAASFPEPRPEAETRPGPAQASPLPAPSAASTPPASPPPPAPGRQPGAGRSFLQDLTSFSFSEMVPLSRIGDPETLGTRTSWLLLGFGLGPLILGTLVEDPLLRVRLFNFACGALWTLFFVATFKTERQSLRLGVAVFFATGVFGILFVSLLQGIPPLSWLYRLTAQSQPFPVRVVAFTLGVALLEEVGKGLILLFLARKLGGLTDHADGVFYGLMSGLGFGVYEAIAYTELVNPRAATALSWATGSPTIGLYAYFVASVVRIVSLPLLHAVWTAIVGYFVGLSFAARRKSDAVLVIGLAIAVVLHGLYDSFLSQGLGLLAVAVATTSLLLFLAYHRNADRIRAAVERADGA